MKTDRELLELAAKAAGIEITWENSHPQRVEYFRGLPNYFAWDPLTDDGDRYWLAKELGIRINFGPAYVTYFDGVKSGVIRWPEDEPNDARAIVRAAAEIGASLP